MKSMNKPPLDQAQLEQFIGAVLRQQPLRQAPATLEARVLQELTQRAARPWWLQGFSRWPWPARALFLPVGIGLVQLSFLTTARLATLWQSIQHSAPATTAQSGLQLFANLGQAVQTLGNMVTRDIPQLWIYGAAGLALLMYAALFGIGAAAFRTLIVTSGPVRYSS